MCALANGWRKSTVRVAEQKLSQPIITPTAPSSSSSSTKTSNNNSTMKSSHHQNQNHHHTLLDSDSDSIDDYLDHRSNNKPRTTTTTTTKPTITSAQHRDPILYAPKSTTTQATTTNKKAYKNTDPILHLSDSNNHNTTTQQPKKRLLTIKPRKQTVLTTIHNNTTTNHISSYSSSSSFSPLPSSSPSISFFSAKAANNNTKSLLPTENDSVITIDDSDDDIVIEGDSDDDDDLIDELLLNTKIKTNSSTKSHQTTIENNKNRFNNKENLDIVKSKKKNHHHSQSDKSHQNRAQKRKRSSNAESDDDDVRTSERALNHRSGSQNNKPTAITKKVASHKLVSNILGIDISSDSEGDEQQATKKRLLASRKWSVEMNDAESASSGSDWMDDASSSKAPSKRRRLIKTFDLKNRQFKTKRRFREEKSFGGQFYGLDSSESEDYEDGDYQSGLSEQETSRLEESFQKRGKHRGVYDDEESEIDYDDETDEDSDCARFLGSDIDDYASLEEESDGEILDLSSIHSSPQFKKRKTVSINKDGKIPEGLDMSTTGWIFDSEGGRYLLKLPSDQIFEIEKEVFDKLYGYQRSGLEWLINRHADEALSGGILADDMGLGKSVQIAAFINGMARSDIAFTFLILSPVSVLTNWEKELNKWAPNVSVIKFHGITDAGERQHIIRKFADKKNTHGRVLLTTYATTRSQISLLVKYLGDDGLNCVILDEGHSIKNKKSQIAQVMRQLSAKCKFVLSGTPIMNNLGELYALYDYIFNGVLLGEEHEFKRNYEIPITASTKRNASANVKYLGNALSVELREKCQNYMLRRDKLEVLKAVDATSGATNASGSSVRATISQKNDLIIYCKMQERQEGVYRQFLSSREVKDALSSQKEVRVGTNPLQLLNILKILCDHHLISTKYGHMPPVDLEGVQDSKLAARLIREHEDRIIANRIQKASLKQLSDSGKVIVMKKLLREHKKNGNRTLIFSQYKRMINLVERVLLEDLELKFLRIDGSTSASVRGEIVERFNTDSSVNCMLLTTQCGSVGLTLTGADRVIILDPNWNPAIDNQAVDRAYRIGQTRNVVIYRLINCSSIEEKIYRKQIFKSGLSKTAIEKENNYRYFSDAELHELFTLDDAQNSKTQQQLHSLHHADRKTYPEFEKHLEFLDSIDEISGFSHHDLLFGKEADDESDDEAREEAAKMMQAQIEANTRGAQQVIPDLLKKLAQQHDNSQIVIDE